MPGKGGERAEAGPGDDETGVPSTAVNSFEGALATLNLQKRLASVCPTAMWAHEGIYVGKEGKEGP